MTQNERAIPKPAPGLAGLRPYRIAARPASLTLHLDGNEGAGPDAALLDELQRLTSDDLRLYPNPRGLEEQLAAHYNLAAEQVIVTTGGDDALDRCCRAALGPGRELVLPVPTFEMLERYPRLVEATHVPVPWPSGPYPTQAVLAAVTPRTGAIASVSPNNPTGAVATADDLRTLAAAAPQALLIVDLAYAEFADEDLTSVALALPNAIAVRTFSKAWGLAGLRVGYALGPAALIDWLRTAGSPYPTSAVSLALASRRLRDGTATMRTQVQEVRRQRAALFEQLTRYGAAAQPSQANFVFARVADAERVASALFAAGIAVRRFGKKPGLEDALRITCPGTPAGFDQLSSALERICAEIPQAFVYRRSQP